MLVTFRAPSLLDTAKFKDACSVYFSEFGKSYKQFWCLEEARVTIEVRWIGEPKDRVLSQGTVTFII